VASNVTFIPKYNYIATAATCVMVQWVVAILFLLQSKKIFMLATNYGKLFKLVVVAIMLLTLNYVCSMWRVHIFAAAVINAIVFLIIVSALKLWQIQKLTQFFASKNVN
jgi:hypothetical protein